MNLNPIKANMNEVTIGDKTVLFSYKTPVAAKILTSEGMTYYKTSKHWSSTTSRHINQWLPKPQEEFGVEEKDQEWFDLLV